MSGLKLRIHMKDLQIHQLNVLRHRSRCRGFAENQMAMIHLEKQPVYASPAEWKIVRTG